MTVKNFCSIFLFLIVGSCISDLEIQIDDVVTSSLYHPLDDGHSVTYQITETIFRNQGMTQDRIEYQIQERVNGITYDGAGRELHILDIYRRPNANTAWDYSHRSFLQISF